MTNRVERIKAALEAAFQPVFLEIEDESRRHASHAGRNGVPVGETHYRVTMVAAAFAGQSRLARQRAVNEALAGEFSIGLHALSLTLRTPEETAT
ncbi:BolA family protein [Acidocella aminolytica]|jgi:BolA protein|uniref:Stress response and cell division protein BolA n=1 Tax=Acidocella aminolytica 101 = DSM 11237 TaxID=1120923 RepID=A0A0D6PN02_9PROT|nr:BolA family protein [Acidocella aminolytica]GAN82174.1 stress response and cell division protein BolA [Acidocella aminolytica 101 = DSM 11237]GBQ43289.1 stress response and cell division protein BolA [Acidocella aminolytica 101 = DSM 11237]SHF55601.1 BolA protein [Acidocella aminolytica 101 = DSM 11237]